MPYVITPIFVAAATTAVTVRAADSGTRYIMPDLTADCTFTLPSPQAGLHYEWTYSGAASDAHDWIIQADSASAYFKGGLTHLDDDAGSAGDEVVPVYSDANSNDFMRILTPDAGTTVVLDCDGTNWYANGLVVSSSAPTFADT